MLCIHRSKMTHIHVIWVIQRTLTYMHELRLTWMRYESCYESYRETWLTCMDCNSLGWDMSHTERHESYTWIMAPLDEIWVTYESNKHSKTIQPTSINTAACLDRWHHYSLPQSTTVAFKLNSWRSLPKCRSLFNPWRGLPKCRSLFNLSEFSLPECRKLNSNYLPA